MQKEAASVTPSQVNYERKTVKLNNTHTHPPTNRKRELETRQNTDKEQVVNNSEVICF